MNFTEFFIIKGVLWDLKLDMLLLDIFLNLLFMFSSFYFLMYYI